MSCPLQLAQTRLVDSHVFLTLEMDGNLETYHDRRRTVLEVTTRCLYPGLHGVTMATLAEAGTH